jgi:leader peptidase (prepilin peptidase)/N-methyltransferase
MPSVLLFELPAFLLGLLLGSFLNVCISRLPHHQSIATPRSHCPNCLTRIRPWDNIPLLSWLLLRARCRHCQQKISWRYPAVELATALWFTVVTAKLTVVNSAIATALIGYLGMPRRYHAYPLGFHVASNSLDVLSLAILGFLLIGLIVMDWQTQRLPDSFTLTGIAIALFLICTQAIFLGPNEAAITLSATHKLRMSSPGSMADQGNMFLTGPEHLIFGRLLAVAAIALLLLAIRATYQAVRHRQGLGLGDVKMLAMVAAFLGFWPAILTLFLATLLATLYALPLVLTRRANALTKLPFGSFLGAAGLISALVAEPMIAWYTSLLR